MPHVFQLSKNFGTLYQGTMTITAYFTKFRTLLGEIKNLNLMLKCSRVTQGCTCDDARKLENYEDMIKCFCLHRYPVWHELYSKPQPKSRKNVQSSSSATKVKIVAQVSTSIYSTSPSDCSLDISGKSVIPFIDAQCQLLSKMVHNSIKQITRM